MKFTKHEEIYRPKVLQPQGVTLIFYIYVETDHFWGFKTLNFNIFLGFQKNEHFWGYEDFVDILLGHQNTGLVLAVISMHFMVFS